MSKKILTINLAAFSFLAVAILVLNLRSPKVLADIQTPDGGRTVAVQGSGWPVHSYTGIINLLPGQKDDVQSRIAESNATFRWAQIMFDGPILALFIILVILNARALRRESSSASPSA